MSRFGFVFLLLIASVAARASEPLAPDYLQCVNKGDGEVIRAEITRDASGAYFGQAKLFDDSGRLYAQTDRVPLNRTGDETSTVFASPLRNPGILRVFMVVVQPLSGANPGENPARFKIVSGDFFSNTGTDFSMGEANCN